KQLPTAGELKTREEADLVQILADAFLVSPAHPDDVALAKRLLSHEAADQIIAGLVRDHLGARPEAIELAAAARRSKVAPITTPGSPTASGVPQQLRRPGEVPGGGRGTQHGGPATGASAPERVEPNDPSPAGYGAERDALRGPPRARVRRERPARG